MFHNIGKIKDDHLIDFKSNIIQGNSSCQFQFFFFLCQISKNNTSQVLAIS